jgi:hypothetical protein
LPMKEANSLASGGREARDLVTEADPEEKAEPTEGRADHRKGSFFFADEGSQQFGFRRTRSEAFLECLLITQCA